MRTADELWSLLWEARDLPYGSARIALFERILRRVDGAGDDRLAFVTRLHATSTYVYGGEPAKALVTFAWCVDDFDRNPRPYHKHLRHDLLWEFKSMVTTLTEFPEVPLARVHAVLDDMERRYRTAGHSLHAVYQHRYVVADHIGRDDEAAEWFARWQSAPRDSLSDCAGCDPTCVADHLSSRGRFADAVALAEPALSDRLRCVEQPQSLLASLMVPYLLTGREQDAAAAHHRSYQLQRGHLENLADIAGHIVFCARTGNEHRGLGILRRHLDWLEKAPSPVAAMDFAAAGGLLLRRLTELGHGEMPIEGRGRADVTVAELATGLAGQASELARRFDERNGTDRVGRGVAELLAAVPFATSLSLSPA